MSETKVIEGWSFKPSDLDVPNRKPGISAFMRIRNGAAFLEATIRSHIAFFDEIVAVHNQCTDATPDILARLAQEFGPKLRVYHYADRVFPQGTDGHIKTVGTSPASVVNYSNCALALTRFQCVTKLDDDHLAVTGPLENIVKDLRAGRHDPSHMLCFSGLNLARDAQGNLAVPAVEPVSGGGDIGFFRISENTHFYHDPRFERFRAGGLKRRFAGYLYWHLKYLKPGTGFANYELDTNPNSRFGRKRDAFFGNTDFAQDMDAVRKLLKPDMTLHIASLFSEKKRLARDRGEALAGIFLQRQVLQAVQDSTDPACFALVFGAKPHP